MIGTIEGRIRVGHEQAAAGATILISLIDIGPGPVHEFQNQHEFFLGDHKHFLWHKMNRIRELPAIAFAIAGGVGLYLIHRALKGKSGILTLTVPATTANLACGFDTFGAAFEFRMIVKAQLAPPTQKETKFSYEGEGADEVVTGESNLIWQSALACVKMHAPDRTLPKLNIHVKVGRN